MPVNGLTSYRDSVADTWSCSASAPCAEATRQETFSGPFGPVLETLFPR